MMLRRPGNQTCDLVNLVVVQSKSLKRLVKAVWCQSDSDHPDTLGVSSTTTYQCSGNSGVLGFECSLGA